MLKTATCTLCSLNNTTVKDPTFPFVQLGTALLSNKQWKSSHNKVVTQLVISTTFPGSGMVAAGLFSVAGKAAFLTYLSDSEKGREKAVFVWQSWIQ